MDEYTRSDEDAIYKSVRMSTLDDLVRTMIFHTMTDRRIELYDRIYRELLCNPSPSDRSNDLTHVVRIMYNLTNENISANRLVCLKYLVDLAQKMHDRTCADIAAIYS